MPGMDPVSEVQGGVAFSHLILQQPPHACTIITTPIFQVKKLEPRKGKGFVQVTLLGGGSVKTQTGSVWL